MPAARISEVDNNEVREETGGAAQHGRAAFVSRCGQDCRSCERRGGCASFMIDVAEAGR